MKIIERFIIFAFLFSIGLLLGALAAYLKNSVLVVSNYEITRKEQTISQNRTQPQATKIIPKKAPFKKLRKELFEIADQTEATWGIVVYDLNRNEQVLINENESYHGASVIKVLTAISILEKVEDGQENFSRKIDGHTIEELITSMINRSDNKAWKTLNYIAGFDNMQSLGKSLGMETVNVYENELSPKDVNALLKALYFGKILNEENRQFLFSIMQNTETEDRIPKGVAENIPVIHKTGTLDGYIHDAAIVMAEKPYILVTLGKNTNWQEGTETIQKISEAVFEYFQEE